MIEFLKNLFGSEKASDQKRERDVILLDAYAMGDEEEEPSGCCGAGGCGSCGCG